MLMFQRIEANYPEIWAIQWEKNSSEFLQNPHVVLYLSVPKNGPKYDSGVGPGGDMDAGCWLLDAG